MVAVASSFVFFLVVSGYFALLLEERKRKTDFNAIENALNENVPRSFLSLWHNLCILSALQRMNNNIQLTCFSFQLSCIHNTQPLVYLMKNLLLTAN